MKTDRLFQIVFFLLRKNNMTAAELAEKLSVSVRTIYRDVEALSMAGIPVYCNNCGIDSTERRLNLD